MMNRLIEQAEQNHGVLKRQVLCLWDEFGNMPAIRDADVLFTAARSRGIRFLISLQSLTQLEKAYGRNMAKIVRDACQMMMFSHTAPSSRDTAKELSEALGRRTVKTGSVSQGGARKSQSYQMMGRALLTPDEIMNLPKGEFVVMKSGAHPVRMKQQFAPQYLSGELGGSETERPVQETVRIRYLSAETLRKRGRVRESLTLGMFDK